MKRYVHVVIVVIFTLQRLSNSFVRDFHRKNDVTIRNPNQQEQRLSSRWLTSRPQHVMLMSSLTSTTTTYTNNNNTTTKLSSSSSSSSSVWFPSRIQDTIDYHNIVQRLFLRHIVTETEAMAKQALQLATRFNHFNSTTTTTPTTIVIDPFGHVAKTISACTYTRDDGGTIGWVECPKLIDVDSTIRTFQSTSITSNIISDHVIYNLYHLRPKMGDMHILYDDIIQRYHVIQVTELWMNHTIALFNNQNQKDHYQQQLDKVEIDNSQNMKQNEALIGSFYGTNQIITNRKSFKGHGIVSEFPKQPKTYSIQTAGCQMNVADSERLEGILQYDLQLSPILPSSSQSDPTKADIVIFNTCSIRDHAEQKVYDAIGPYAIAKRKGKQIAIIVTGCVAQQEGELLLKRIPEIDAVIGPQYIPYLQNIIETISYGGQQVVVTAPMLLQEQNNDQFLNKPIRGHTIRAWVNVIHGCNEHCTYCVVPGTRGMEQSRTMESILNECIQLYNTGYKEVTLLGQNIDAYGRDMIPKRTFAELLEYLDHNIPNKMRIRYVTSHPRYFSDRVIDAVATLDKVCECFHMPFQAGDDEVLRNMRRGYTYESYMNIIRKIRHKAPDAAICADIIVGFPGETEEQFTKTLQLMNEVKFDNINSFIYSPRPNTEAALYKNQINDTIKFERLQRVQHLAMEHGYERSVRYLHRIVEVLVEDVNPKNSLQQVMGRTRQGRQVYFDGNIDILLGQFVNVKITEARTWSLMGELV
jgi:tRNA-2-methylthio-N6-dimethylallyladenosine synthase